MKTIVHTEEELVTALVVRKEDEVIELYLNAETNVWEVRE